MNYERKYKELVGKIKKAYLFAQTDSTKAVLEDICPEIKESKEERDERVRKELISIVKSYRESCITEGNHRFDDCLAWLEKQGKQTEINLVEILKLFPRETELYSPLYGKLWLAEVDEEHGIITCYKYRLDEGCTRATLEQENTVSFYSNGTTGLPDFSVSKDCMLFLYDVEKQSEQKPTDKVKPKFKVGDWIVDNRTGVVHYIAKIKGTVDGCYYVLGYDKGSLHVYNESDYHLWTIKDAKDGDVLVDVCGNIGIFEKGCGINWHTYCYLGFDGRFIPRCGSHGSICYPATKEQQDYLFQKMGESGYMWDEHTKMLICSADKKSK